MQLQNEFTLNKSNIEDVTELFLNRELEWLEFNSRVLHEAVDERTPLLERVKFLEIFTSNLDEFFMKRVGGLKKQIVAGVRSRSLDGLTPSEQINLIREKVKKLLHEYSRTFSLSIRPDLSKNGIHLLSWDDLRDEEKNFSDQYFKKNVFPVLTPLSVDPAHPFPFISNLSTSLGVTLKHPEDDEKLFARVKIPMVLQQWIRLSLDEPNGEYRFIGLYDLIRKNIGKLFPNMEIVDVMPFRITRNADLERDEEDTEDLLELIEEELRERRFADVVRLEHGPDANPWMLNLLMDELDLRIEDLYEVPFFDEIVSLKGVSSLNIPKLRYEQWTPCVIPEVLDQNIFSVIKERDILVHHPYESFSASVEQFIKLASEDPLVLAIKMTLYRIGDNSPFVPFLIRAAESGKQVVCLIELKARFDEERNIQWAQALESAGVHVVYGIVGLKTHAKVALVVRNEGDGLRCYAHFGTGNYHVQTSNLYTDLGFFTSNPEYTNEIVDLFHFLTGVSRKRDFKKILVAPINMKDRFLELIESEIKNYLNGRPARIIAKMNSLEDQSIIRSLYRASNVGVSIDLIVRGFSVIRPQVKGLSVNIRVISVIGRFLEHSRIFYFQNGELDPINGEFFIGSADWMRRNLLARLEVVCPIEDRGLREKCWEILQLIINDKRQAWEMQSDGHYEQRVPETESQIGSQSLLMNLTRERVGLKQRFASDLYLIKETYSTLKEDLVH